MNPQPGLPTPAPQPGAGPAAPQAGIPGLTLPPAEATRPVLAPPAGGAAGRPAGAPRSGGLTSLLATTDPGASDPGESDPGTSWPGTSGETAAGPAPAAVLSRLATDPRLGWWLRRAILSAVTGTAMAVLTSWRLGVTTAILTAIADTLLRARTSAAIPAPVRLGSAQRRTRRRLRRLAPSGYLALHRRLVPGSTAVIDHLVAGPAGVFAVHSERWDRRLPVRATRGGGLCHGPYPQAERLQAVCWQAAQAGGLLTAELGEPVTVRPAMVIYGPPVPWTVMRIAGVDVFPGRRLRKYLRRETAASRACRLGERQIELIHAAAARVLPPAR